MFDTYGFQVQYPLKCGECSSIPPPVRPFHQPCVQLSSSGALYLFVVTWAVRLRVVAFSACLCLCTLVIHWAVVLEEYVNEDDPPRNVCWDTKLISVEG